MNKVFLLGNLGQNPELKYTPQGSSVCQFSVATKETYTKDNQKHEKTEWHSIVVWGKVAELCNQYIKKGSKVLIEGKLQTSSWDDKDGKKWYKTEINASNVTFLDKKPTEQDAQGNGQDFTSDDVAF